MSVKVLNPDNLRVPIGARRSAVSARKPLPGMRHRRLSENARLPRRAIATARWRKSRSAAPASFTATPSRTSRRKGFTAPSFQAFIDLPEGPRVFSLIGSKYPVERGVLEDGMEMRLIVEPLADTPEHKDELTYKYVPANGATR